MAQIMIIDDDAVSRIMLGRLLEAAGHEVGYAEDGSMALERLGAGQETPRPLPSVPDLILLDVHMPKMDGYQTCRALKADPRLHDVPVIFISALTATDDKIKAFSTGGVDYVTKPFQSDEVMARVATHLRIARLQVQLEERYEELKESENMRDLLTHMIVHDLRSPLGGIVASLQLLQLDIAPLGEECEEDVALALSSTLKLRQMITALLDVNKMESGEMPVSREPGDLYATARAAVGSLSGLVAGRDIVVEGAATADFDPELIERVVANLVSNALRYTPDQGSISVRVSNGDRARVEVRDQGPGIPEQYREMVFEKFGQIKAQQEGSRLASTGLGRTNRSRLCGERGQHLLVRDLGTFRQPRSASPSPSRCSLNLMDPNAWRCVELGNL